jgi:hypothetical protein
VLTVITEGMVFLDITNGSPFGEVTCRCLRGQQGPCRDPRRRFLFGRRGTRGATRSASLSAYRVGGSPVSVFSRSAIAPMVPEEVRVSQTPAMEQSHRGHRPSRRVTACVA